MRTLVCRTIGQILAGQKTLVQTGQKTLVQTARHASRCRLNFHEDCERGINEMINAELCASYQYQLMAFYFDRDDVALPGFSSYFNDASLEERVHAERFMAYLNKRGGRILASDIKSPSQFEWGSGLEAMQTALNMEKKITLRLYALHGVASAHNDAQMTDFLEGEFLEEQVQELKKVSDHVSRLQRAGHGLGEYLYDVETLGGHPN